MKKYDLIMSLLNSGKITSEEALVLFNPDNKQPTLSINTAPKVLTLEEKIENVLNKDFFDQVLYKEDSNSVENIITFMGNKNWRWLGKEVTVTDFEDTVKHLTHLAMSECLNEYKYIRKDSPTYGENIIGIASTGGIKVTCTIEFFDDHYSDIIDIMVEFIAQSWYGEANVYEFK